MLFCRCSVVSGLTKKVEYACISVGGGCDGRSLFRDLGGKVQYVRIQSEKGRDCIIVNPWPGKAVIVYRDGKKVDALKGDRFTLKSKAGETITLGMEGG